MPSRLVASPYYGGKNRPALQDRILAVLDRRQAYLEPFCGSAAILLNRQPVKHETINDIDGLVVNFFRCLRDLPAALIERLKLTPYAREEHAAALAALERPELLDGVERARAWYVATSFSVGSISGSNFGLARPRGRWSRAAYHRNRVDHLHEVAERLRAVQIESCDAVDLIAKVDDEDCVVYADPPYPMSTRSATTTYRHDGSDDLHERLLDAVLACPAQVVLSCYDTPAYRERLANWHRIEIDVAKCASACANTLAHNRAAEVLYCSSLPAGTTQRLEF